MSIKILQFPDQTQEFNYICDSIQADLKTVPGSEIAVIARGHKTLKAIQSILLKKEIPVSYQSGENVLDKKIVYQLLTIWKFTNSLLSPEKNIQEELLPEILSFEFFEIKTADIIKIAMLAKGKIPLADLNQGLDQGLPCVFLDSQLKLEIQEIESKEKISPTRFSWLEIMLKSKKPKIYNLTKFLINLAKKARTENFEKIMDYSLGNTALDDYLSPLKSFYFQEINQTYLDLLQDLKTLVSKIREKNDWQTYSLTEVVDFVDLLQKNKVELNKLAGFENQSAVSLLTAHKAKGLEFEKVYIVNCTNQEWIGKARGSSLNLPLNLPFAPEKDEKDDKLRLFFVAITRAKMDLILSFSDLDKNYKATTKLQFLEGIANLEIQKIEATNNLQNSILSLEQDLYKPEIIYTQKDLEVLKPLVQNYKMSVTHLENFLDITSGGPMCFVNKNLLNFPQAKIDSGSYGTAVHEALKDLVLNLQKQQGEGLEFLLERYEIHLKKQNLDLKPFEENLVKGKKHLTLFYHQKIPEFNLNCEVEKDFVNQGAVIGGSLLTGKIDRLERLENKQLRAIDYKTGKAFLNWKGKDKNSKIKLWKYEIQLLFYKILVENSSQYQNHKLNEAQIEFIENVDQKIITLPKHFNKEELERLEKLIQIVYQKIQNLDFPNTSNYSEDLKGIKQFEEDLLLKKI
jgi:DNA helicase-2/ATP-dependent DNA helicase PcrA